LGGQSVELVDIELAKLFDVDRSAVLEECAGVSVGSVLGYGGVCENGWISPCQFGDSTEGNTCQPRVVQGIQSFYSSIRKTGSSGQSEVEKVGWFWVMTTSSRLRKRNRG